MVLEREIEQHVQAAFETAKHPRLVSLYTSPLKFPLRNSWGHLQLQAVFFVEIDPARVGQEQGDL